MKMLHTSDWHLGRSLYGRKRYEAFTAFRDWLAQTIEDEKAYVDTHVNGRISRADERHRPGVFTTASHNITCLLFSQVLRLCAENRGSRLYENLSRVLYCPFLDSAHRVITIENLFCDFHFTSRQIDRLPVNWNDSTG